MELERQLESLTISALMNDTGNARSRRKDFLSAEVAK